MIANRFLDIARVDDLAAGLDRIAKVCCSTKRNNMCRVFFFYSFPFFSIEFCLDIAILNIALKSELRNILYLYFVWTHILYTLILCTLSFFVALTLADLFFFNTKKPSYEQFLNVLIQLSYCHHYIELSPDLVNLKQFWKFNWILEWQHLSNTPYSGTIPRNRYWDQGALRHLINSQFNEFNLEYKFECLVIWSNLL